MKLCSTFCENSAMLRARWLIFNFRRYSTVLFLLTIFLILFFIYSIINIIIKVNNNDYLMTIKPISDHILFKNPLKTTTAVSMHQLYNNAEYRKQIFQKKINRLSQKIKRPHVFPHDKSLTNPNYNVHIFYYAWYGNLKHDKMYSHWNHDYLPSWKHDDKKKYPKGRHAAPLDIGSNFYPALNCYSSRDPKVIERHMQQIKFSGVGVIAISWAPPGVKDSPEDILPVLFHYADLYNLKITLHIEPYISRNPINLRKHLKNFFNTYLNHPALYKIKKPLATKPLPLIYIYDSYLTPIAAWKELLDKKGHISIRGTEHDAIFIGLIVEIHHRYHVKKSHFDGFYTYFASNGFSHGSSWKNWNSLANFAQQNGLVFIPSVGPGYIDTQVRPWNNVNTRHRRHGQYYDVAWRSAISSNVDYISITSFNEWHEGTQIEPAKAIAIPEFTYQDYEPEGPDFYLNLTKWWVAQFSSLKKKSTK